jgi:hypothetical protein
MAEAGPAGLGLLPRIFNASKREMRLARFWMLGAGPCMTEALELLLETRCL